jgi:signal peptidase I
VQKLLRFLVWLAIVLGAIIGILRTTAIRWWQVPADDPELGASLGPTLRGGDWVILWRLTKPNVGSLVVCPDPDDPTAVVMGRIAARGGQVVELQGPVVKVDGKVPIVEYNCTEREFTVINPDTLKPEELSCAMEDLGGTLHMRGMAKPSSTPRAFNKVVQGDDVFLVSDNRVHPFDSRHFGPMSASACRESVVFRLVSQDGFFDVANRLDYIR